MKNFQQTPKQRRLHAGAQKAKLALAVPRIVMEHRESKKRDYTGYWRVDNPTWVPAYGQKRR